MSDASSNRRRDMARDAREASHDRDRLRPYVPVKLGSDFKATQRNRAAIEAKWGPRKP